MSLITTLSTRHRAAMAEFQRVGYVQNGWNAMRRWNGRTAALELAGIEGPSRNAAAWKPSAIGQDAGITADTQGARTFRYRYKDSRTGYVSNPSNEVVVYDLADGGLVIDNRIDFSVGGAGATIGPDSTGTGFAITTTTLIRNDGGSWITDGFKVGDYITAAGAENAGNNGTFGPFSAVTASTLTISTAITNAQIVSNFATVNADDTTIYFNRSTLGRIQFSTDAKVDTVVIESTVVGGNKFFVNYEFSNSMGAGAVSTNITDAALERKFRPWPDLGHDPAPPTSNLVIHANRLWLFGSEEHSTGTADFTNGSVNVGDGTTAPEWITEALGASSGDSPIVWLIQKDGDTAEYEIDYFDSGGAQIVLKKAYAGATTTNSTYRIFSRSNNIWVSNPGYPEGFTPERYINGPNAEGAGALKAGVGFGSSMVFFTRTAMFRYSWDTDPLTDGFMTMLSTKAGALSQRVVVEQAGSIYTMDRRGWHSWDGGAPENVSLPLGQIQDSIDFTYEHLFFGVYLPNVRAIRWFVTYTGDTFPKNYVQLDLDTKAWATGVLNHAVADARVVTMNNKGQRLLLMDASGYTWWGDTGVADGLTTNHHLTTSGVPTTTVIPTTSAALPVNGLAGMYLSRKTAAGATESRQIASNTADTITVAAFSSAPATATAVWVGAFSSKLKTKAFGARRSAGGKTRTGYLTLTFEPVSSVRYLQVRVYEDYSATAKTWGAADANTLDGLTKPGVNTRYPTSDWLVDLSYATGVVKIPVGGEWRRFFEVELEIDEPDADFNILSLEFDGQELESVRK